MYKPPITAENFQEAWDYCCKRYRKAKKSRLLRALVVPVSQILFFLCFLFLTFGITYDGSGPLIRGYLQKAPFTLELWHRFSAAVLTPSPDLKIQLLSMVGFLYGVPLAGAAVFWLLGVLLYHPKSPVKGTDPSLYGKDLWSTCKQASDICDNDRSRTLSCCNSLFALTLCAGCVGFLLCNRNNPAVKAWLQDGYAQASLYFVIGCAVAFICYLLLNLPLRILASCLYFCRIPRHFMDDAQDFYWQQEQINHPAPFRKAMQEPPQA